VSAPWKPPREIAGRTSRTPKTPQTPKGRTHNTETWLARSKSGSGPGSKLRLEPNHKPKDKAEQEEGTRRTADLPGTSTSTMGITRSTIKLSRRVEVYVEVPALELLHMSSWRDQKQNAHGRRTPQAGMSVRFGVNGNDDADMDHDMDMDDMDMEPPSSPTKNSPVKTGDQDE
jgi:hypothetical protein